MDAEASPLPSEDTTPPVTKMNLAFLVGFVEACSIHLLLDAFRYSRDRQAVSPA